MKDWLGFSGFLHLSVRLLLARSFSSSYSGSNDAKPKERFSHEINLTDAEQAASANAGSSSRLHFNVLGPAWLR
jgi:hypothetical protein